MTYSRVIPRDLFNEANLLKCYGQLYLKLEQLNLPNVELEHERENECFEVVQDQQDGSLWIANVLLRVRGLTFILFRPLNSREPWPLYLLLDGEEIAVFTDSGEFTPEMLNFLKGQAT